MKKIVIIHGNGGCTKSHFWIPWLKAALKQKGFSVAAPTMPDNVEAKSSVWLPYMRDVLKCDANTVVIGHSSGAVAAMRYAEEHQLLGSVLIGACYTDLGHESERLAGYYSAPWQWDKIKKNQRWTMLLASTDDPYIPVSEARFIHDQLGSDYVEFTEQGHFMDTKIPDLLPLLFTRLID